VDKMHECNARLNFGFVAGFLKLNRKIVCLAVGIDVTSVSTFNVQLGHDFYSYLLHNTKNCRFLFRRKYYCISVRKSIAVSKVIVLTPRSLLPENPFISTKASQSSKKWSKVKCSRSASVNSK
jgi:hypothetical protein